MADEYLRQSALAHLGLAPRAAEPADAGVHLTELGPRAQFALRADGSSRAFVDAVRRTLGLALPGEAGAVSRAGERALAWLGPDEWLAVLPADEWGLGSTLEASLGRVHHLLSDVSHSRGILRLEGPDARRVLMKGSNLDFHPRAFPPGRCAQSRLGRGHVLVEALDGAPTFNLFVHRSFLPYTWSWLEDAAAEYGLHRGTEQVG